MSGPTDSFLERLASRTTSRENVSVTPAKPELPQYESVQRYAKALDELPPEERDRRLHTLREFAEFVGRDPDQMVEEIYNRETRKYRKRGFYSDNAKAFAAQLGGPQHLQLARSNVIRSFFIANGYRLPPERPDWM